MNGSYDQRRDELHDDDLGLGIVEEVASTSRTEQPHKARGWIFGIVGLVLVVVLGAVVFSLITSGSTKSSKALDAPDAVSTSVELRSGGTATVTTSDSADALAVQLSGLPALEEDESYVVWGVDGDGHASVLLETSATEGEGGKDNASELVAVHISVESAPIPDSPSEDAEASVDLPLEAGTQATEAPQE